MIRLIAVAFVLAVATSAQAMSPAPLHQPDGMVTQVRVGCVQWVAVALNERLQRAGSEGLKP